MLSLGSLNFFVGLCHQYGLFSSRCLTDYRYFRIFSEAVYCPGQRGKVFFCA